MDAATKAYVDTSVAGIGGQLPGLNSRINDVDQKSSGGVALALATTGSVVLAAGESAVTVGTGAFGGQGAVGMSFAHSLDLPTAPGDERWYKEVVVSVGLGVSTVGDVGGRAAVSFKF